MAKGKIRSKHWRKDWHHRVPDFKLVNCRPKKIIKKEVKQNQRKRNEVAVINDEK